MFFEEEYRKIIEQLKRNEDYAVMRTICENIIEVLKENGVKVDGTIVKNVTRTKPFEIADDFYVKFNGLDFTEHDKRYVEEIKALKKQISELESELSVKEDLLEIKNALCEEEPLPFSDEQYEEEPKAELPTMPIDVASMLINAKIEYPTPSICKVFGAGDTSVADKYSKNDLKEIAEHLLVYCNNSDDDEDDTQS